MRRTWLTFLIAVASAGIVAETAEAAEPLRAGIIGCDTSHVIAFAKLLNNPDAQGELAEMDVVAAYPGGSQDIASSRDRVGPFTEQLREMGVLIVDSIPELLKHVDVVLLESLDGRVHLEQARPVMAAGKPLYIDKPLAGSLADAVKIFALAKERGVPCFSSSSLRFSPGILSMRNDPAVGRVMGCDAFSPCTTEPHHPDLYWYGVHGVEILFTIMGTGCESVTRVKTEGTDVAVGTWSDGRVGIYRGIRAGASGYGAIVFGEKAITRSGEYVGYEPLVVEIVRFFKTGRPPVSAEETIEMFAFMEAADESHRQGGVPVTLAEVLARARGE
jgi:hypothetical protein